MASSQSLLGQEQKHWMYSELITSQAKWNVLAQQVMMGLVGGISKDGETTYSMDQWPGYAYERQSILKFLDERSISNPVVLTGDIHSNWVNELRVDDRKPEEKLIATEFVATSLSSGGNGKEAPAYLPTLLSNNPCVKFHNEERGYIRCEVTPKSWRSDYMVVSDVLLPGGSTNVRRSFLVESGNPKVVEA
jgi:alkaline phosphatase D